ncbi:EAL domain-containing protein [Thermostichus sp. MS-CIW-40]
MDVTAEGIETLQQLHLMRLLNCEYGQGYFFAKPDTFTLNTAEHHCSTMQR